MPHVCSDCLREYKKVLSSKHSTNNEEENYSNYQSKLEYCKKIAIFILKFIIYCFLGIITLNIVREIFHGLKICLWNFAFYFINPFLKILIWSLGLFFLCFKDKFFNDDEIINNNNNNSNINNNNENNYNNHHENRGENFTIEFEV